VSEMLGVPSENSQTMKGYYTCVQNEGMGAMSNRKHSQTVILYDLPHVVRNGENSQSH
jgi:hypothetical protein